MRDPDSKQRPLCLCEFSPSRQQRTKRSSRSRWWRPLRAIRLSARQSLGPLARLELKRAAAHHDNRGTKGTAASQCRNGAATAAWPGKLFRLGAGPLALDGTRVHLDIRALSRDTLSKRCLGSWRLDEQWRSQLDLDAGTLELIVATATPGTPQAVGRADCCVPKERQDRPEHRQQNRLQDARFR